MIDRILCIQHVPFEGPGYIEKWALDRGIKLEKFHSFQGDLPEVKNGDGVLLMGGPMSVNDDLDFLNKEKKWVDDLLNRNIHILGICLGAQLLAERLGSKIYQGPEKEIGWFPLKVDKSSFGKDDYFPSVFNDEETVFHWHGEIFDIPKGCSRLFFNDISPCQGFYKENIIGLQFHLETTSETASMIMENCPEDMDEKGKFIQTREDILHGKENFKRINSLLEAIFDWWIK